MPWKKRIPRFCRLRSWQAHTLRRGAFRRHVARLVDFLKALSAASEIEAQLIAKALEAAETGRAPDGQWFALACDAGTRWQQVGEPCP